MTFFCEHGKVIWILSVGLWYFAWNKLWLRQAQGSFFFRYEYPALIGYMLVSFIALIVASEALCWCETCK